MKNVMKNGNFFTMRKMTLSFSAWFKISLHLHTSHFYSALCMDTSLLYAVCSANPEARLAQEKVRGNYENPVFVEWVVGMCQKLDTDPQILNVLCLVLVDLMRHLSRPEADGRRCRPARRSKGRSWGS